MKSSLRRRASIASLSAALVTGVSLGASACGSGGGGCQSLAVRMPAVRIATARSAFDISATVSAGKHPVAGLSVQFWGWGHPLHSSAEGTVGTQLGTGTTAADGTVAVHMEAAADGTAGALGQIGGTTFVNVEAETEAATVGGKAYCPVKEHVPVTCTDDDCTIS